MNDEIESALKNYFIAMHSKKKENLNERLDKSNNAALFYFWSGPGTGKTRNLHEFPNLCLNIIQKLQKENEEMPTFEKKPFIFNINMENGHSKLACDNPVYEVGFRMFFQCRTNPQSKWNDLVNQHQNDYNSLPEEVLKKLGITKNDLVIFLVDGVLMFDKMYQSKNSNPQNRPSATVAQYLSDLMRHPFSPYTIVAISSLSFSPMYPSGDSHVNLTPIRLDPYKIDPSLPKDNLVLKTLFEYMDGHGRTLQF